MKLEKDDKVRATECDCKAQLSPIGVYQRVQETVTELFGEHGIGSLTVRNRFGCMWVYVKNRVILGTPAQWNEKIRLSCSVARVRAYDVLLHTVIYNSKNEITAESWLEICLVDIKSQTIARLSVVGLTGEAEAPSDHKAEPGFVRCREKLFDAVGTRRVCATNIDLSQHTNNIEYLRFVLDALTASQTASDALAEIQMEYFRQSFEGEELCLENGRENPEYWRLSREGTPVAGCRLIFR